MWNFEDYPVNHLLENILDNIPELVSALKL